ncbi:hypothetical protein, partial [Pseudotamlana agarivorans]|uniref:hypothetical protein n=1 Tax=Pseudotamlana agarivorans TaxID=481183 RepID=UPI000A5DAE66
TYPNDTLIQVSYNKFISENLNIKDTTYVIRQRKENLKLNLNQLSKYGFNVFDLKGYAERNVPYNSILEMIDSLNQGTENYNLVKFTKPIFNKNKSLAYIRILHGSDGKSLILEKNNGKWRKKIELESWIECW